MKYPRLQIHSRGRRALLIIDGRCALGHVVPEKSPSTRLEPLRTTSIDFSIISILKETPRGVRRKRKGHKVSEPRKHGQPLLLTRDYTTRRIVQLCVEKLGKIGLHVFRPSAPKGDKIFKGIFHGDPTLMACMAVESEIEIGGHRYPCKYVGN